MRKLLFYSAMLICSLVIVSSTYAQKGYAFPDSVKYRKNVIKWNLTPFILWSKKNINLGYERVLSPYRSFSVNAGYFELPKILGGVRDSLNIQSSNKRAGLSIGADYRFYFKTLNKKRAPNGLYWGVFANYYHYQTENEVSVVDNLAIDGSLKLGVKANVFGAGVQLGYQFVVWKDRMTIDLIFMGPSVSAYAMNFNLSGDIAVDVEDEYIQAIYDILSSRIPGLDELVSEGNLTASDVNVSMGYGMRYMIQIGFRF